MNLKDKRVLITGGSGFLGRRIVTKCIERGAEVCNFRSSDFNLTVFDEVMDLMHFCPHIVIHSAAYYGGIMINKKQPAKIYIENMLMGTHLIEACVRHGVEKFVGVGTACSYPGHIEGELHEDDLWSGPCHESVRCYGAVKKMMQIQCEAYKAQHGLNGVHLLLANLYGEWDSYNTERSHVVAALIRKFVEAKRNDDLTVMAWGTGSPIREFLYVDDAAEGIVRVAESYDSTEPINIGTGIGTTIKELTALVHEISGFEGEVVWDHNKPDGATKKVFNVNRMVGVLKWAPEMLLTDGLEKTIRWFEKNYKEAIKRW